jgi:hypothetical protein
MKNQALFLFLILLAGLILCSFLGGSCQQEGFEISTYTGVNSGKQSTSSNTGGILGGQGNVYLGSSSDVQNTKYDNYNHKTGTSYPTMYYGPNGATAKLVSSNGVYSVIVTDGSGNASTYTVNTNNNTSTNTNINTNTNTASTTTNSANATTTTYYGPNGGKASIVNTNGATAVQVVDSNGNTTTYVSQNPQTYNPSYDNTNTNVTYSSGTNYQSAYAQGPFGGSAGYVQGPAGNSAGYVQGPAGNTAVATNSQNPYYSAMPRGIPGSQIPTGQEDLYILKSEIVPPVCPACPTSTACPRQEPCPACPPCGRCPEPSFECKKVPNYNSISSEYLPQPVLSSFSSFGM